jgi:hypothetical protein
MKTQPCSVLSESTRSSVAVRVAASEEIQWFDGLLKDHHYLGAGHAVGDYLRQVIELDERPVALLVWGHERFLLRRSQADCAIKNARSLLQTGVGQEHRATTKNAPCGALFRGRGSGDSTLPNRGRNQYLAGFVLKPPVCG